MTTIKYYFSLQFTMLKRQLTDFGVNPITGFIIIAAVFCGLSVVLFNQTNYASYLYVFIATSIVLKYSEAERNDFLKFTFSKTDYFKIRLIENGLTAFPFIIFLGVKAQIYPMLLLIVAAGTITMVHLKNSFSLVIPTPFFKKPFEFVAGFRTTILAFPLGYFVVAMSIIHQNINLGLFTLLFLFLVCLSFYSQPEDVPTVWVHQLTVNGFLYSKIKTAIIYSSLLTLPVAIGLGILFSASIFIIIGIQLLGYLYLIAAIVAKYAAFPQKMNLPQALLLGASMLMPPFLLAVIPFFYVQSRKRLKEILE